MGAKLTAKMLVETRPGPLTPAIGSIAMDNESGARFVRVTATAAIAQYDAVRVVAGLASVQPTSAADQAVLGVAQSAIANGASGWVQIDGQATCKVVAATAAGAPLASTATAGTLGVAAATSVAHRGIASVTGVAAGSAIFLH